MYLLRNFKLHMWHCMSIKQHCFRVKWRIPGAFKSEELMAWWKHLTSEECLMLFNMCLYIMVELDLINNSRTSGISVIPQSSKQRYSIQFPNSVPISGVSLSQHPEELSAGQWDKFLSWMKLYIFRRRKQSGCFKCLVTPASSSLIYTHHIYLTEYKNYSWH